VSKISDKELNAGLRQRKPPEIIAAEVRDTIVSQMHVDAMRLPMDSIFASPYQVRQITTETLEALMESIKDTGGLITPVVVRPSGSNYELITGHTRYLACKRLEYTEIPAVVRSMSDAEAARALAADNLTRKDLTDFEIFKQLDTLYSYGFLKSKSEASRLLGRTRQDIIRYDAYGELPSEVIEILEQIPSLFGGSAAKTLKDYLPTHKSIVIEACRRLASKRNQTQITDTQSQETTIHNQAAMLSWIEQQLRDKPIRHEQRVLDKSGMTVGKIVWGDSGIKVVSKSVDLLKVEAAIKLALEDQGYRL
jgi:ParB family chromosome partitioning protein